MYQARVRVDRQGQTGNDNLDLYQNRDSFVERDISARCLRSQMISGGGLSPADRDEFRAHLSGHSEPEPSADGHHILKLDIPAILRGDDDHQTQGPEKRPHNELGAASEAFARNVSITRPTDARTLPRRLVDSRNYVDNGDEMSRGTKNNLSYGYPSDPRSPGKPVAKTLNLPLCQHTS
jgi:hypothetical protein